MAQYKLLDLFGFVTYVALVMGLGNFLFASDPFVAVVCGTISAGGVVAAILMNNKFLVAVGESFFILCVLRLMSELWKALDLWVQYLF